MQQNRFTYEAFIFTISSFVIYNLEEFARIEGETYHGTHGLRYNYVQNLYFKHYDENVGNGMTYIDAHKTALKQTSEEIGHHRAEIMVYFSFQCL